MAYATPAELRDAYRVGLDRDELAHRDDADLARALERASAEIDSWRPAGDLSTADLAVLKSKVYPLARDLLYHDQALAPEHPVRAEAAAARRWLQALAAGGVRLPSHTATATEARPAAPQVSAPAEVFGADFRRRNRPRYPWER